MKKLQELETEIECLKHEIFCQENGNDLYYSSPLYQRHLFKLQALEREVDVLRGKLAPFPVSFENETAEKRQILSDLAVCNGSWYASCYKDLRLKDLEHVLSDESHVVSNKSESDISTSKVYRSAKDRLQREFEAK